MTKEDNIKLIAERVMGWEQWYIDVDGAIICVVGNKDIAFNPYESDADCMAMWDEFSEDKNTELYHYTGGSVVNEWEAKCHYRNIFYRITNKDRRTAMCECVVKAVSQ